MRRLTRAVAAALVATAFATSCANPSDEERNVVAAALDRIADSDRTVDDGELEPELALEEDPFGLEDTVSVEEDRGIGVVTRDTARPQIDQFRCPFEREDLTPARCGKIELPGRGEDPRHTIRLAFVRFSATGEEDAKRPDPVVYLHGGPGGSILDEANYWYDSIVAPHIEFRDVILYDQRGAGRSSALPPCDEVDASADKFYENAVSHESLADEFVEQVVACAERLDADPDVDLTAYNSATNAQDLVDLMWALGVETYNIHGSSYGTRLAQTVMRDAPGGVRSIVLGGTYPIEVNLMGSITGSLEKSLDAVFTGCANTPECAEALPDPWSALESLVADLDRSPLTVPLGSGFNKFQLRFDGVDFLNGLHNSLYVAENALAVPDLLIDYADGDNRRLVRLANNSIFDHSDVATFLAVQCADEGPFTTPEDLVRPIEHEFLRATDLPPSTNGTETIAICEAWHTGATDPMEAEPVTWDVPTLIISGGLDPITPPEWAADLAERLPRGRLIYRADASHDADEGPCAIGLIATFVESPDLLPDSGCAVTGPLTVNTKAERFQRPLSFIAWNLDLDDDGEWFEASVPDWNPVYFNETEIFWRDRDPLDPTSIVIIPADNDYDPLTHLVVYELSPEWTATASPVSGWERSSLEISTGALVAYENAVTHVRVVLVSESIEPSDLESTILVPVVESIGENQ